MPKEEAADIEPGREDPVETSSLLGMLMMSIIAFSAYGTYYLAVNVMPREEIAGTPNYILGAIPFFILLVLAEMVILALGAAPKSSAGHYDSPQTWSSFAAGTSQQVLVHLLKKAVPTTLIYCHIYENYGWKRFPETWLTGAITFITADFFYYWLHRHTHVYHLLWAGHAFHHNGERYNLSNALRQSWLQGATSFLWYLPMALFVPPRMFLPASAWVTLYQFWVHTCTVRQLPQPIELIFATPSHHRVHHDRRVHKNFGGVLIIWDRLFGTFQDELQHRKTENGLWHSGDETCYFGIKETISSWADPVLQFQLFGPALSGGLRSLFVGPGWKTAFIPRPLPIVCPPDVKRFRTVTNQTTSGVVYLWLQYALVLIIMVEAMIKDRDINLEQLIQRTCFMIAALAIQGFILDGTKPNTALSLDLLKNILLVFSFTTEHGSLSAIKTPLFLLASVQMLMVMAYGKSLCGRPEEGGAASKSKTE